MNGEIGFNADGAIATVTLSNPDKPNTIDSTMWRAARGFRTRRGRSFAALRHFSRGW